MPAGVLGDPSGSAPVGELLGLPPASITEHIYIISHVHIIDADCNVLSYRACDLEDHEHATANIDHRVNLLVPVSTVRFLVLW